MSIEVLTTKAVSIPLIEFEQSDNQISNGNTNFFNDLTPVNNQILNYNPEKFHNQGNSISSQIIESIANLDSSIKNMNKEINSTVSNTSPYQDKDKDKDKELSFESMRIASRENTKSLMKKLQMAHKVSFTIQFVQAMSSAFTKTLNKFLKM